MQLWCATLTPFRDGTVDLEAVDRHVRWLRARGVDAFGPTGTTGEFLYLRPHEKAEVHRATIEAAEGAPVVPCVWESDPGLMVDVARRAQDRGAAGVFAPPPLFQPVKPDDVVAWYGRLVDALRIPVWSYHHPRTHNPLDYPLLERLFDIGVHGLKDSSGDLRRVAFLARCFPQRIVVGGEGLLDQLKRIGPVVGHMSRLANLRPGLCRTLVDRGPKAKAEAEERDMWVDLIGRAGKLPAMKHALGMGSRAPITWFDAELTGELVPED